jgi:hypothetical protein
MYDDIVRFYLSKKWQGCYGLMSIIHQDFIDKLNDHGLFTVMNKIDCNIKSYIEQLLQVLACYIHPIHESMFGEWDKYISTNQYNAIKICP